MAEIEKDVIREVDEEEKHDLDSQKEKGLGSSTSNLLEVLHGGRPKDEEPHVKKVRGKHGEKITLILNVDTDELGISEDEFEDLQSLFELFDHDKDGILNIKETMKLLRCLGFRANEGQAKAMVSLVSIDTIGFSVSFNEYLRLVSLQRRAEPSEETLLDIFQTFDPANTGEIEEVQFRKIMRSKEAIPDEEVEEMLTEYRRMQLVKDDNSSTASGPSVILYKEFISMLQQ